MVLYKCQETIKQRMVFKMTRGWYWFADGSMAWFNGLSKKERENEVRKHGAIIKFERTK